MNPNPLPRQRLADLVALRLIADSGSFVAASAQLGLSASALSHAMRQLETTLGQPLLLRTTRRVSLTQAGEALLRRLAPALDEIEAACKDLSSSDEPCGKLRITTFALAARVLLWPLLPQWRVRFPRLELDIQIGDAPDDLVLQRYDAGIRLPGAVPGDMQRIPVGPALRMCLVASPEYLAQHGTPRQPEELMQHHCLRFRFAGSGRIAPWSFQRRSEQLKLIPPGPLVSSDSDSLAHACKQGAGITMLYDLLVSDAIANGELVPLLPQWMPPATRLQLYHPHRGELPRTLAALIGAIAEAEPIG